MDNFESDNSTSSFPETSLEDLGEEAHGLTVMTDGISDKTSQGFLTLTGNVQIHSNTVIIGNHNLVRPQVRRRVRDYPSNSQFPDFLPRVQSFLKRHYQTQLNESTPLPWCQDFQLSVNHVYTTLELVCASRHGGEIEHNKKIELDQLLYMDDAQEEDVFVIQRVLLEGNPGYGKTTLSFKLISDWANSKQYLAKYELVFLIVLRNFKGDLKNYIEEHCMARQDGIDCNDVWDYIGQKQNEVLFVLDGLDELPVDKSQQINELIGGKLFQNSSVVVTTRPLKRGDETLRFCKRRVIIQGFNDNQIGIFIRSYFGAVKKDYCAEPLIREIMNAQSHYRHLATCPMACLMLCVLYQDKEELPEKLTDIYGVLLLCLIRRSSTRTGTTEDWTHGFPTLYERVLNQFGHFCYKALRQDQLIFEGRELEEIMGDDLHALLASGLLLKDYNATPSLGARSSILRQEQYQLLHKTFIEYLAAYYLASVAEVDMRVKLCTLRRDNETSFITVAKFLIGLLSDRAHVVIKMFGLFEYPDYALFDIVRECTMTTNNLRVLSAILSSSDVLVSSRNLEVEGWGNLLDFPSCGIRKVEFKWDEPPVNREFLLEFADKFMRNESVANLKFTYSYALELTPEQKRFVSQYMARLLEKPNLRTFAVLGNQAGSELAQALAQKLQVPAPRCLVTTLELQALVTDEDITLLTRALINRKDIMQLLLTHFKCTRRGYTALAELLAHNTTLSHLTVIPEGTSVPTTPRSPPQFTLAPSQEWNQGPASPYCSLSPECDSAQHSDDIHKFITALRDPRCVLRHLDLFAGQLTQLDFNCLGQTIRYGRSLQKLALPNVINFESLVPIFTALEHNLFLEELDVHSPKLNVNDNDVRRCIIPAISGNRTLQSLDVSGWTFNIEVETLRQLSECIQKSNLSELNVGYCSLLVPCEDPWLVSASPSSSPKQTPESRARFRRRKSFNSVMRHLATGVRSVFHKKRGDVVSGPVLARLSAPQARIFTSDRTGTVLRASEFLPHLASFRNLTELDLSSPVMQTFPGAVRLDYGDTIAFFNTLYTQFGSSLQVLSLSSWVFVWNSSEVTANLLKPCLSRLTALRALHLKHASCELNEVAQGIGGLGHTKGPLTHSYSSLRRCLKQPMTPHQSLEHLFLASMLTGLPALQEVTLPRLTWRGAENLLPLVQKLMLAKTDLLILHLQYVGRQAQIYLRDHIRLLDNVAVDDLGGTQGTLLIRRLQPLSAKNRNPLT